MRTAFVFLALASPAAAQHRPVADESTTVPRISIATGEVGEEAVQVTEQNPFPVRCVSGCIDSNINDSTLPAGPQAVEQSGDWEFSVRGVVPVSGTFWQDNQPVTVTGTVPVSGTFFQPVQPISGTVGINGTVPVSGNFYPATQPVSIAAPVAVTGSFFQATQPISGTVGISGTIPVTGSFYQANQPVTVTGTVPVSGSFYQANQPVTITGTVPVSGQFYQSTQPVSAATLPLPTGAATSAQQTSMGASLTSLVTSASPVTPVASSSEEAGRVIKATPGSLHGLNVVAGATAGYVLVFNSVTVPADGPVSPVKCLPLAATSGVQWDWRQVPVAFSVGITVAFSTTGCFTKTSSPTAFFSADAK